MKKGYRLLPLIVIVLLTVLGMTVLAADKNPSASPVLDRILAKKELVVGTAASMPPLNMKTKDGRIIGLEMDLAQLFAGAMEVKLTVKPMPFSELLPALEAGKVDMVLSSVTMTPARNLKVAFVGPYFVSGKSLLTKMANVEKINSIDKMNNPGTTLVALKGSTSQLYVEKMIPKARLVLADDYDRAVAMVRLGQAVAMIADFPICMVSVNRYPEAKLGVPENPLSYEPIGVALPPNDPLLVNWVQNALGLLEKGGEMKALMDRWFKKTDWMSQLP